MADSVEVAAVIMANRDIFNSVETISVKPSPEMKKGRPDYDDIFIEVVARRPALLALPEELDGIRIRKFAATMEEQAIRYNGLGIDDEPALALEWQKMFLAGGTEAPPDYSKLTYKRLEPSQLIAVEGKCTLLLHTSPDAGWSVLNSFLATGKDFDVAMYDLTAPHITGALEAIAARGGSLDLCLGPDASLGNGTKANDIKEEVVKARLESAFGDRFRFSWASVGHRKQFPKAYHIKVAVREGEQFWLSSGNWQSSNQPETHFAAAVDGPPANGAQMARYNREWHIVVDSPALAKIFQTYIDKDRETSAFDAARVEAPGAPVDGLFEPGLRTDTDFMLEFRVPEGPDLAVAEAAKPFRTAFPPKELARKRRYIMPLLTPDNYGEEVLALIESATSRLWFQNQSLSINAYPTVLYRKLLTALREKAWEIEDTRIFFREFMPEDTKDALRALDRDGFPMEKVRVMKNLHTKAFIVDGDKTLIGSHNWTNQGTNFNRDASLIIHDEEVNAWYAKVLDHDWQHLARKLRYDLEVPSAVLPLDGEVIAGIPKRIDPRMDIVKRA